MRIYTTTQLMRAVGWDGEIDVDTAKSENEKADAHFETHDATVNKLQRGSMY